MNKINSIFMIALAAILTISCDDKENIPEEYYLTGDMYVGTLTILGEDQEDITFYGDESSNSIDLMMPDVSFMPGLMPNLDMALINIPLASDNPNRYYTAESQMVGIYDHLPLINDVIQSISNVEVICEDETMTVSFDCAITTDAMGDMTVTVTYVGYTDDYVEAAPEFTLDNTEGFYITTSSGDVLLENASVTYYQGNNALVIDGFSYSANLSTTTLSIVGVTSTTNNGKTTLTTDGLEVNYTFMGSATTGTIFELTCEIIDGKAQMVFSISASMGNSGTPTEYPCTFNGDITIVDDTYETETPDTDTETPDTNPETDTETPEFSLDNDEGFYITTSSGTILLSSATVTYYQGDNALVIDGFSYSAYLSTTTLPIIGVTAAIDENNMTTLTADNLAVSYIFMTMDATGTIYDLTCEIIDGKAQMIFSITAAMPNSDTSNNYPCTFNGNITIESGNYITD